MEPNEFRPSIVESVEAPAEFFSPSQTDFRPISPAEYAEHQSDNPTAAAQSFLPSFFRDPQPLGHSRPYYTPDHTTHRFNGHRASSPASAASTYDQSILGSGDFGVIRGGTFYQQNDPPARGLESNDYYSFYKNNGHGRPQAQPYTASRQPSKFHGGFAGADEQFSNFRDFADINTPSDPAYSHFVVVYANKNDSYHVGGAAAAEDVVLPEQQQQYGSGVAHQTHANPKNIFEQLQNLDREKSTAPSVSGAGIIASYKKSSIGKFKNKLSATKLQKKYKKKISPKDLDYEPLLALS